MPLKRKLVDMSAEEFLAKGLDTDDDSTSTSTASDGDHRAAKGKGKASKSKVKVKVKEKRKGSVGSQHKASLEKLKDRDPEFYAFLKNEDKDLLAFEASDDEEEDGSNSGSDDEVSGKVAKKGRLQVNTAEDFSDDSSEESDGGDGRHRLPSKLEVASDSDMEQSSSEDEDTSVKKKKVKEATRHQRLLVTRKMVNQWSQLLRDQDSMNALHEVILAFKAAVQETSGEEVEAARYKVEGSQVFNAIVRLCITDLPLMLTRLLQLPKAKNASKTVLPSASTKWKKIKIDVKSYLTDLLQLVSQLSEPGVLNVILKHLSMMISCYVCFPKLSKLLLKRLISVWSTGEETSRVLAFICINRLVRALQNRLLEYCLKQMYMAYVKNCKFTSPTTLPLINFMQRSLVEMFAIDMGPTYQYAFIYIRQLAIHLRNAVTVKKKETAQAVYSWQYIHSLHLWTRLLSTLHPNETLQSLIYPLTQTIIGTIKLVPTARYYPLRFHCVRNLNTLAQATGTFIPTLPFIVEVLEQTDFNKKHKSINFKPFNFACILKLSKAQLHDKCFKDGIIDQLYEQLVESLYYHAHMIAFPEMSLPALLQLKKFLKQCKVANYTRQIKQIVDKVDETSKVITQRRKTAFLSLQNTQAVEAWERRSKEEGTPLAKYHATWRKLRDRELQHEIVGKDRISTDNLPAIERRPKGAKTATETEREEFSAIFDAVSDDSDDEIRFLPKEERPKKRQTILDKEKDAEGMDESDGDYSDFDEADLEQLAESASEDSETDSAAADTDDEDEDSSDGKDSDSEEGADEIESEALDKEDIVEDFQLSSSEGED